MTAWNTTIMKNHMHACIPSINNTEESLDCDSQLSHVIAGGITISQNKTLLSNKLAFTSLPSPATPPLHLTAIPEGSPLLYVMPLIPNATCIEHAMLLRVNDVQM